MHHRASRSPSSADGKRFCRELLLLARAIGGRAVGARKSVFIERSLRVVSAFRPLPLAGGAWRPADPRKSFGGSSGLLRSEFQADPLDGGLFPFYNRRRDRLKISQGGGTGFRPYYERLEAAAFQLPAASKDVTSVARLPSELANILSSIDLSSVRRRSGSCDRPENVSSSLLRFRRRTGRDPLRRQFSTPKQPVRNLNGTERRNPKRLR
jgi:hypothetical protein